MDIVIGIGEYAFSDREEDVIRTHALGSCVALTAYCPKKRVLGMVHIALPDSNINPSESKSRPGHFADTAIPLMLSTMSKEFGCHKHQLVFNMYGGSHSGIENDIFKIGKRNVDAVRKLLDSESIACCESDVGGFLSRTVEAAVSTGDVRISTFPLR